jgi:hypothetical protein
VYDYGNGENIAIVRWNSQEPGYEFLIKDKWNNSPATEQLFLDGVNNSLYEFAFDPISKMIYCIEADGLLLVPIDFSSGDIQNAIEINNQIGPVGNLHWHHTEEKIYCLQGNFELGGYHVSTLDHETGILETVGNNINIDWGSNSTWVSYLDEVNNRLLLSAFNYEENSRLISIDLLTGELLSDITLIEHDPNDLFEMQDRFTNPIYSISEDAVIGLYYGDGTIFTGVQELEKAQFQMFPNPCSDHFSINTGPESLIESVKIMDMEGRLCQENYSISPASPILIYDLQTGIYTVQITQNGQVLNQKLLIK